MLRWLYCEGGGLSQDDVMNGDSFFADDSTLKTTNVHDVNVQVLLAWVNSYGQWAGVKINMGRTEVTSYDCKQKCPLDLSICQLGNGNPKIVMLWDSIKYLRVRHTITGDLTFERDNVRKKTLDTIKQLTKHMYHPQLIHWEVHVAIIPSTANWNSQQIVELENLWMRAFKKEWGDHVWLPDETLVGT